MVIGCDGVVFPYEVVVPHWNWTFTDGFVPRPVKVPFKVAELQLIAVALPVDTASGPTLVAKVISEPYTVVVPTATALKW
jgi:hypothetical protein